jgi:putative restriction endonuclease
VSLALAEVLSGLIGPEAQVVTAGATVVAAPQQHQQPTGDDLDYWEHTLEQEVVNNVAIPETDREAIIRARRGQDLFKQRAYDPETRSA